MKPLRTGYANLNFTSPEALLEFSARVTGTSLRDDDGYEGVLAVMLSPFQEVPGCREGVVEDPLCGTFEASEEYQRFLKAEAAEAPSALPLDRQLEAMMEQERALNPWKYSAELGKATPLLEYLRLTADARAKDAEADKRMRKARREVKKKEKERPPLQQAPPQPKKKGRSKGASVPNNPTAGDGLTVLPGGAKGPKGKPPKAAAQQPQGGSAAVSVEQPKQPAPMLKIMSRPRPEPVIASSAVPAAAKPTVVPAANPANANGPGPKVFTTSKKASQQGPPPHARQQPQEGPEASCQPHEAARKTKE